MGTNERLPQYARPAMWGFFICLICAALALTARVFVPSFLSSRWNSSHGEWREHTQQVIHNAFQLRTLRLRQMAEKLSQVLIVDRQEKPYDLVASLKSFQILNSFHDRDDQTFDIVDAQGDILAWSGPSITTKYSKVLGQFPPARFTRLTRYGLHTYLTVGIRLPADSFYVLVSEPLELNSPISNRFVQNVSFSTELSQLLKTQVTLIVPQEHGLNENEFLVPVTEEEGTVIAEFSILERTLESEIASIQELCGIILALCAACGSLFLAGVGLFWIAVKRRPWLSILMTILSLWILRIFWRLLEVPSNLIGGWFFSPNLYASPFAFGLSSSLGELMISLVVLALSTWLVMERVLFHKETSEAIPRIGRYLGRAGSIVVISFGGLLMLWFFRGFDEALRSFIFDSTIHYNVPAKMVLDGTAALMHVNVLLLAISLFCVSVTVLWIGKTLLMMQFPDSEGLARIALKVLMILCIPFFAFVDETPLMLLFWASLFVTLSLFLMARTASGNKGEREGTSQQFRLFMWIVLCSFLIGTPILHQKLSQRERKEVEIAANEFLRPSDSWLSYIVLDGLRLSAENMKNEFGTLHRESAKENNLAFILWTKTLLGKEGYNSALVLYDPLGNEVDRFVVGMNKQEQREILTRVFESEEDAIHVTRRAGPRAFGQLYGGWLSVRDSSGQVTGSLALLLAEHQKTIFHDEETEPLRQFGDRLDNNLVREIAVHEFRKDTLIFSTGRKLSPDRMIPTAIMKDLQGMSVSPLWRTMTINGYKTQTMFVRDPLAPERYAAISLEDLDFRWELFSYLKEFSVYLFILALLGLFSLLRKGNGNIFSLVGFRGKLFLGFACITLVPLITLSYYNRQLVAERVQEQVETMLFRDLSQLQERIETYITDEEDFVRGVDDDFCEALTAEYGIDFSVYRHALIQASSRSELYRADLLDGRLMSEAFASIVLDGKNYALLNEKIGSVNYVVGYAPLSLNGSVVGVLAIPTLNRQKEIESELAQRNVYVFGAYAIVFGLALAAGGFLTLRLARPLQQLTHAAKKVSKGNLDVSVAVQSHDEIGLLAQSFNEMVAKLKTSRIDLAKHERESAWKEMAKQVAHEIRNPLTPIKLSMQHVRQAFKDKASDREDILQRVTQTVIEQIEALSRIASEFSLFAKMPESKYERVEIDGLLHETINLFREIQGIEFVDRLDSTAVTVVADHELLRGVFINIIRNAIQAIESSGTITLETSVQEHRCSIKISDTGSGISEDIRDKIFEPNFSTKTEGMGLGLAIARRVIEDHGGTITCESQRGKGTIFEICLPI